jgi:hypothetical protein
MITTIENADAARTPGDFVGRPGRSESSACAMGVNDGQPLDQLAGPTNRHSDGQAAIDSRRPAARHTNRVLAPHRLIDESKVDARSI